MVFVGEIQYYRDPIEVLDPKAGLKAQLRAATNPYLLYS